MISTEFADLKKLLEPMAADSSYPETFRVKIGKAIGKIEEVLDSSASDPDLNITDVGVLLEDAMNAAEESLNGGPVDQSADSVAEQGDGPVWRCPLNKLPILFLKMMTPPREAIRTFHGCRFQVR